MAFPYLFRTNILKNTCSSFRGLGDGVIGIMVQIVRSKHYDPKFRWLRSKKVVIPFHKVFEEGTGVDERERMIELNRHRAVPPARKWLEKPMFINSSSEFFDPYVPVPGDGMYSKFSEKWKRSMSVGTNWAKQLRHVRKIKRYDPDFNVETFAANAPDIYIRAHTALANKALDDLYEVATEKAVNLMTANVHRQTLHWKFIESLEPPQVVHIRTAEMSQNKDYFAQVTVRFFTKQILALYDRFGRLMCGSETVPKDVLEYVVFEKYIVNIYGLWRLHGKIIPDWLPTTVMAPRTYMDYEFKDKTMEKNMEMTFKVLEDEKEVAQSKHE